MSYFRSYFEKNNTIIKNSDVNTSKYPATELYYGNGFSKFIFKVDFTDLILKINNGDFVLNNNTKHYLNMTNTIFGDETMRNEIKGTGRKRTSSFDLIVFKINEDWDEGTGYDYEYINDFSVDNNTYDIKPSNWYNRNTLSGWTTPGIYDLDPEIITTIHFDNGNENIKADITTYVNGILSGETNYGIGLAFSVPYQSISNSLEQSVAFFTKYTQTFFEPFVETIFDDRIDDDRKLFIENVNQNLYLYVTKGTNFYDLDTLPTVDILDPSKTLIPTLSGLQTTKVRKGVYKVTLGLSGQICDGRRFFYDKWKGLSLDNIQINDVIQKFIPNPYTAQFTVGENQTELQRYSIQYFGIKQSDKIKQGDIRKIVVSFRSIDVAKTQLFKEVYYRIFVKEGHTDVIVFDWTQLDVTNENSFYLDTNFLIPREYFIEFKGHTHTEEIYYKEQIKFEIVSEK